MREGLAYFQDILENFESEELRKFFIDVFNKAPRLFFEAQSKQYDQPGGLICKAVNSSIALEKILGFDFIKQQITQPKKRDCLRIAVFYSFTDLEHINNMISRIENLDVSVTIKQGLRVYIANLIRQYNHPTNLEEYVVWSAIHSEDMNINSQLIRKWATPEQDEYFIPECYKYSWCNFTLAIEMDRKYFEELKSKPDTLEPLRTLLEENL